MLIACEGYLDPIQGNIISHDEIWHKPPWRTGFTFTSEFRYCLASNVPLLDDRFSLAHILCIECRVRFLRTAKNPFQIPCDLRHGTYCKEIFISMTQAHNGIKNITLLITSTSYAVVVFASTDARVIIAHIAPRIHLSWYCSVQRSSYLPCTLLYLLTSTPQLVHHGKRNHQCLRYVLLFPLCVLG